ncbi:MAG TPA: AsnC family transcriptional regulator [Alphaproteobacteria bacterium]|jgi:DNA-binding Lrp family transcriptional regulator|nr:AsnC family transcriptional regulator [Rhodospirillaceae bacterium]MBL6671970.1 Lrp/AsnC family transcriptional regulator [Alphaproteobacteria bacterium]HAO58575.1 AsnC family transcriptional regulator [Alphaproteobacteria bacterium]HBD52910.1 AsnC family transcriptional regulator [Alphaproteobacteria bacterium]HBP59317.1 AsnC family transcriptional regulator [Alphaproteobacteria bacterium]|tara:strand:+ start:3864 stop:4289 length:426 start_codon:yes stop_codon:yes gene_type:complete
MKDLDNQIIALLKRNARMLVTQMARELGVSRVTIDAHIKKMETSGVISGYTVKLGTEEFRHKVSGWILISVQANKEEHAIEKMIGTPEITRLHTTNGKWDLAAEIQVPTLEHFDAVISKLRQIDGITETDTSLLLSSRIGE